MKLQWMCKRARARVCVYIIPPLPGYNDIRTILTKQVQHIIPVPHRSEELKYNTAFNCEINQREQSHVKNSVQQN